MDLIVKYGLLGVVLAFFLFYRWYVRKQGIPTFMDHDPEISQQLDAMDELFDDGFYCIMTKDGCRSGWIKKPGTRPGSGIG